MYMSLRMIQKPPVIFTQYDPSGVIGRSELALALGSRKSDALPWLWLSYGHSVLAEMDPCMEANEGAAHLGCHGQKYDGSVSKGNVGKVFHSSDQFGFR